MIPSSSDSPWHIADTPPTTLIVAWPHDEPPLREEVLAAVQHAAGGSVDRGELEGAREQLLWSAAVDAPGLPQPILLMGDHGGPFPDDLEGRRPAINPRWVIVVQSMLSHEDPLADFARLLRLVMQAVPESPAVLDLHSTRAFTREELGWLLPAADVEPPADCLWTVHAVRDQSDQRHGWLHTHGLWRCGRPEFELLDVPADLLGAAGELINIVSERSLEGPLAPPGQAMALGKDLDISLQPWQEYVKTMPETGLGGRRDREEEIDGPHAGVRAVICAPRLRGVFRKVWTPPVDALRTIQAGRGVFARSQRASERAAALARATWPELAMALADLRRKAHSGTVLPDVHFLVKAAFSPETGQPTSPASSDATHEHMWVEIEQFDRDRAAGKLLNQPMFVQGLHKGDSVSVDRAAVSEWSVLTPAGRFEPGRRGGLREAIAGLVAGP